MCIACDCAMRRLLITPCASRCASSPVYVAGLVWTNHMPMHVMKLSLSIIDESAKAIKAVKPGQSKKSSILDKSQLLASSSYNMMLFLVMSSTIGMFLVERESSCQSLWQANHTISPEFNFFSKIHTIQIFKIFKELLLMPHSGYTNEVCGS